jgi:uncharacterized protein YodC (DUF2158 family)
MSEQEVKVGDVVHLRSGGPNMTVNGYQLVGSATMINCAWFNENKELKDGLFAPGALRKGPR